MFLNRVPMDRDTPSPEPLVYLFTHSFMYVCRSPQKGALLHIRKHIRSPCSEPHADGRPTYNGVRPGSPRGSLTTLLSLTQCHAALGTIPSTLAWVDQRHVSQCVLQQPPSGYTHHNCYRFSRDPGQSTARIYDTPRYGRGVGFMGSEERSTTISKYQSTLRIISEDLNLLQFPIVFIYILCLYIYSFMPRPFLLTILYRSNGQNIKLFPQLHSKILAT